MNRYLQRRELLYENHCTGCHTSRAHLRDRRRATSVPAVKAWVRRWSSELKLGWTTGEIAEVTRHLVRRTTSLTQQLRRTDRCVTLPEVD